MDNELNILTKLKIKSLLEKYDSYAKNSSFLENHTKIPKTNVNPFFLF